MNPPVFSAQEMRDLEARALPSPTVRLIRLEDLDGAVLFGAGAFSDMLLPVLQRAGVQPGWFVDRNPALWGLARHGLAIHSTDSLADAGDRLVVVMTHHFHEMAEVCRAFHVPRWGWFTGIQEIFGNYAMVADCRELFTHPEPVEAMALLEDPESRLVFKRALAARITGAARDYPPFTPDQYFSMPDLPDAAFTRFVDVGAYTGDTLRAWMVSKLPKLDLADVAYHAFEPDPGSHETLAALVRALPPDLARRITTYPVAVGASRRSVRLVAGGPTSVCCEASDLGSCLCQVRLDDVLGDVPLSMIKIDVEGGELGVLEGARAIIRRWKPALLVAVYHRTEHLWQVPRWIHACDPGYTFRMAHHDRTVCETVCYALRP